MSISIGETKISLLQGDISSVKCEAIVNAANNALWMGAGVAGAIKRKGGQEIEREAVAKGPIEVGQAVATGAGRLEAKYVIHAAAMGQDLQTDEAKIAAATRNSLLRAKELNLKSIAFPALGTGVGGFSRAKAAEIMLRETVKHIREGSSLNEVLFVLYDDESMKSFSKVLSEYEKKS